MSKLITFTLDEATAKHIEESGFFIGSTAWLDFVGVFKCEDTTSKRRELDIFTTGIAICKQPLSNYPQDKTYYYAALRFDSGADLMNQLVSIGWAEPKTVPEYLVGFETAVIARSKGFRGQTIHPYICQTGLVDFNRDDLRDGSDLLIDYNHPNYEDARGLVCSAPTQEMLRSWLREYHDINAEALRCAYANPTYNALVMQGGKQVYNGYNEGIEDQDIYTTYSEAQEVALAYALNLLKDV